MMRILEACCGTAEKAALAERGGASRIELCEQLEIGGVTPSESNIRATLSACKSAKVNVLIRPRGGDFVYDRSEAEQMLDSIRLCKELGVNAVVIGALKEDGQVDKVLTAELIAAARPLKVTFHRAFDVCADPLRALDDIIELGCDRLLTSGHEDNAYIGRFRIAELVERAAGRIVIMAGCGVRAENIDEIERDSHADEYHSSSLGLLNL